MLAVASFIGTAAAVPAFACEGGKCTMQHSAKDGAKTKKGKKGAQEESCHMTAAATDKAAEKPMSCCMKKEAPKTESPKETKDKKAQQ